MEFIKEHHSQEFVKEVLRISCDGNMVRICSLFNVIPSACLFSFSVCFFCGVFFFNSSSYVLGNALSICVQT